MTAANITGRVTIADLQELQRPPLGWYAQMGVLTIVFMLAVGFPRLATTWVVRGILVYNSVDLLPDVPVTDEMTAAALADKAMRDAGVVSPVETAVSAATSDEAFKLAMTELMKSEGAGCNDPTGVDAADNGGLTCKGVTQETYNASGYSGSVTQITQEQAEDIYRKGYWEDVSQYPAPLNMALFNIAVNSGPGQAEDIVDKLNAEGGSKLPPAEQALKALDLQQAYYQSLGDWATYGTGWSNRTTQWKQFVQSVKTDVKETGQPAATVATDEVTDYFIEIATKNEFGTNDGKLRRWEKPVVIAVNGGTAEDLANLQAVVVELNQLTGHPVSIVGSGEFASVEIHFAEPERFKELEPNYVPGNLGFFRTYWEGDFIGRATILVTNGDRVSQAERNSVVREELTQSMGLPNDSFTYKDSIFQQAWTDTQQYSEIDKAIIKLLYDPRIKSGMDAEQIREALK